MKFTIRYDCKRNSHDECGLCAGTRRRVEPQSCWHDLCKHCDEIRVEHRYGLVGCGRNTINFEVRE